MRILFLSLALSLVGCANTDPCAGQSGTCIGLRVTGTIANLDQLAVSVDAPKAETLKTAEAPLTLPVKLPLIMPAGTKGTVHVGVDGLARGGRVAHGSATVTLSAGGHVVVTVALVATGALPGDLAGVMMMPGDGDGGSDGGPIGPDMGCGPGLQDNDKNGTCMPDCTSAALVCAAHQVCSDAPGTATCVCAAGYVLSSGTCTWGVLPADPGFQNMPANAWTLTGGVTLNAAQASTGQKEPGVIVWDKPTMCTNNGRATQTITMPPLAVADPLALTVYAQQTCSDSMFCEGQSALEILVNGRANFVPTSPAFPMTAAAVQTICLGDGEYGGTFDVVLKPWDRSVCSNTMLGLQVDHVSIDVNAACPTPGTVLNGDFSGATGWTGAFYAFDANPAGASAGIAATAGPDGSRAGQLLVNQGCAGSNLTGTISPSVSGPSTLAMQLDVRGNSGHLLRLFGPVGLGSDQQTLGVLLGTVTGTASYETIKICIGQHARGIAYPVMFKTEDVGGSCGTAIAPVIEWDIDNVQLVSDATCSAPGVNDPGFERTDAGKNWTLTSDNTHNSTATIDTNAVDAHGGTASLSMNVAQSCGEISASGLMTVPPASGSAGPALKFWYKLPLRQFTNFTVGTTTSTMLPIAANYTQETICLDPATIGEPLQVTFAAIGNDGACGTAYSAETLHVDDLTAATDPSCPAM